MNDIILTAHNYLQYFGFLNRISGKKRWYEYCENDNMLFCYICKNFFEIYTNCSNNCCNTKCKYNVYAHVQEHLNRYKDLMFFQ